MELLLEDTGSLHGTFRRSGESAEEQLSTHVKTPVRDGDILRFGSDVYRGQRTFPPQFVRVDQLAWSEGAASVEIKSNQRSTPSNTFCVPDYDDDEDLPSDSDDIVENYKLPSQRFPEGSCFIDLDQSSPKRQSRPQDAPSSLTIHRSRSDVIDLTSEPETPSVPDGVMQLDAQVALPSSMPTIIPDHAQEEIVIADDSNKETAADDQDVTFVDGQDSSPSSPYPQSSLYHRPGYEYLSMSESEGELDMNDDDDDDDSDGSSQDEMESDIEVMSAAAESNQASDMEDLNPHAQYWHSSSDEMDDDGDDRSEQSAEECDDPLQLDEDNMSSSSDDESVSTDTSVYQKEPSPEVAFPSSSLPTAPRGPFADANHSWMSADMALQWHQPPQQQHSISTVSTATPASFSQTLGERTGKYDFFAAREQNRATVVNNSQIALKRYLPQGMLRATEDTLRDLDTPRMEGPRTLPKMNVAAETNDAPARSWVETVGDVSSGVPDISLDSNYDSHQPPLLNSFWTPTGEAFLKDAHQCQVPTSDERTRLQSPDLDMSSAAKFVESKNKPNTDDQDRLAVKFLLQETKNSSCDGHLPAAKSQSQDLPTEMGSLKNGLDGVTRPPKRSYDTFADASAESEIGQPGRCVSQKTEALGSSDASAPTPNEDAEADGSAADVMPATTQDVQADPPVADPITPSLQPTQSDLTITDMETSVNKEVIPAAEVDVSVPTSVLRPYEFTAGVEEPNTRPAKRRRFSKLAKYASVSVASGFTGAALLFAGLAATAPQIM
ncbi:hypothetical protein KJ359_002611 [Pestalotiopsis sp. 9143b]|nr:hypothetical protein KJ359_002611 [Pestalotiopsis sp. 9143b]